MLIVRRWALPYLGYCKWSSLTLVRALVTMARQRSWALAATKREGVAALMQAWCAFGRGGLGCREYQGMLGV